MSELTSEQIDALLATRIMGWELLEVDYIGSEYETLRQKELADWIREVGIESVGSYWINVEKDFWTDERWSPSTDIAQAWRVLEHFRRNGYSVVLQTLKGRWVCSLNGELFCMEVADTAPLAICLAASKALGD